MECKGREMRKSGDAYTLEREHALASGLDRVAAELMMVDLQDYIAFIRLDLFGNLENIVNSSTELHYLPGTLKFGMSGDVEMGWDGAPRICLDMVFEHQGVQAYFRLGLSDQRATVEMTFLSFADASCDPDLNTQMLKDALASARLPGRKWISRLAALADADLSQGEVAV